MHFLIYVSIATKPFSGDELVALLERWRDSNARAEVTGMLLYKDGNFMQVIEGEAATVRALFTKISADPRHHKITTLLDDSTAERQFADWSMGFADLDAPQASGVPGYSEFMNTALTADAFAVNPTRAQKLLRIFKRT
jgi:hypothetical protein